MTEDGAPSIEEIRATHRSVDVGTTSEWDLIMRCRAGSAAAFEPLVRRHEARALALAEALLGDADDAADAVQDAFVKAYRSLGRLRAGSDFGAWFRTILRNHCMDRLRSARRRRRVPLERATTETGACSQQAGSSVIEQQQLADILHGAMAQLSAEHREILVLKEIEGLSYAEIASATGVPGGTVASRIHHARSALRRLLLAADSGREERRA
jgi:RNA polymerase sigma-70 factor, ECF subfamily